MIKPNKTKKRNVGLQIFLVTIPIVSAVIIAFFGSIIGAILESNFIVGLAIVTASWVSIPLAILSLWAFWRVGKLIKGVIVNVVFNISMKFAERTSEELSYILLVLYIIVTIALIVKWSRSWNERTESHAEENESKADDEADKKEKESQR